MSTRALTARCPLRGMGCAGAVLVGAYVLTKAVILPIRRAIAQSRFRASLSRQQSDTVYLYGFPRPKSAMGMSVPVLKVEAFLRLNGVKYEYVVGELSNSPTGRMPFVSYKGRIIVESDIIIDFLKQEFGVAMDATLTPVQHATGLALRRTIEMHAYACSMRSFMVDNFPQMQALFQREMGLPWPLIQLITRPLRKTLIASLNMSGIGDLSTEECYGQHAKDVMAMTELLGDGPFLFGSQPSTYDCAVFAYLYVIKFVDANVGGAMASRVHVALRDNSRAAAFLQAMQQRLRAE